MTSSHYKLVDCEDGNKVHSREVKGKRMWTRLKHQLVDYNSLPGYLRDNEFILSYYRAEWPLKDAFLSIFSIHNETLNVWTHLIGFFLFLFLTIYTATTVPDVVDLNSLRKLPDWLRNADLNKIHSEILSCLPSLTDIPDIYKLKDGLKNSLPNLQDMHKYKDELISSISGWKVSELLANCLPEKISSTGAEDSILQNIKNNMVDELSSLVVQPITRWPFYVFLGGGMFCLLASSICHLLSCHSERLSYIMLRLDYAGIAVLISTSFYPPVYYSFACFPFFSILYLSLITTLGVVTILFSLFPVFQRPEFRIIRASLFFGMGFSGVAPIIHKLILYWNQPEALQTTGYEILMGTFYGLGALIYSTRIPERWEPGKFDIAGHSHQIFHVLVVAGAYTHYRAGLIYLQWRDSKGC